jgi:folate-binding protein YgfZ
MDLANELNGVARLTNLGAIRVEGDDAAKFLHGQLTQDFALLGAEEARLCALCSPQGRMLASFIGFKNTPTDIVLVCSADLVAAMVKRLSMFVLRAKVKVTDATAVFSLYGLAGECTRTIAGDAPWACQTGAAGTLINLYPAHGIARQVLVNSADEAVPAGPELSADVWAWSEVCSGVATLTAPVSQLFVPQMLNFESVGGVSFKKGCYPGQEVVARSQFRGTLKRRAFIAHSEGLIAVGDEAFSVADPEQPVGTVVQASNAPGGGYDAIVSLQLSAVAATESGLHVRDAGGPALKILPMPYELLADV